MKLTKNKMPELLAALVVLVVYNVVFFALPLERNAERWNAYGFSMLAIILLAGMSFYALWRGDMRSKFYRLPVLYVTWIYAAVQIAAGFLFIFAAAAVPLWLETCVNVLLLAACLLGLIAVELGVTEINRLDEAVREKVFYIQSLRITVESMAEKTVEGNLKKALKEYAEAIRYSDPMSSPALAELERALETKTALLGEQAEAGNADAALILCGELRQLLAEREKKCKLLK